jgi:glycosyltransferase involved in cell wall biosynthesis
LKISIITPSFNQGQFIEQTIDSVLSQNYSALEYIIIDGGSTDNSVEIIKKYEKHLTYWVSEPDRGQTHAINKGLAITQGELFNWINSDDYYEPGVFDKLSDYFSDSNVNVVCGKGNIVSEEGKYMRQSRGSDVYNSLSKTIGYARMDQPETFFRRSVLTQTGLLNDELHYLMDRDLWIKYLFSFGLSGIQEVDDTFINFRMHHESKTGSQFDLFQIDHDSFYLSMSRQYGFASEFQSISQLCETHEGFELKIPSHVTKNLISEILSFYFLKRADEFYYRGDRAKSKKCLEMVDSQIIDALGKKRLNDIKWKNQFVIFKMIQILRRLKR